MRRKSRALFFERPGICLSKLKSPFSHLPSFHSSQSLTGILYGLLACRASCAGALHFCNRPSFLRIGIKAVASLHRRHWASSLISRACATFSRLSVATRLVRRPSDGRGWAGVGPHNRTVCTLPRTYVALSSQGLSPTLRKQQGEQASLADVKFPSGSRGVTKLRVIQTTNQLTESPHPAGLHEALQQRAQSSSKQLLRWTRISSKLL